MAVPLSPLVLLQVVHGGEQSSSLAAESCRSAVGLEDEEFRVHVLGFKSPISVCYMKFPFHKDMMIWVFLSCQYLGYGLGCCGARCSAHVCKVCS